MVLLFPAVGIGLLGWALRATLRYRRYGISRLELTTLPAPVGHALDGNGADAAGAAARRGLSGGVELHPAEDQWNRR